MAVEFDIEEYIADAAEGMLIDGGLEAGHLQHREFDESKTLVLSLLEGAVWSFLKAYEEFISGWKKSVWDIEMRPLRASGRREDWVDCSYIDAGPMFVHVQRIAISDDKFITLSPFDIYSSFRARDVPDEIFRAGLGDFETPISRTATREPPRADEGCMILQIGDKEYEMRAPPADPDAELEQYQVFFQFVRYLVEEVWDPIAAGVIAYLEAPGRFPALKRAHDGYPERRREDFIEDLVSERFAEAILREAETGFPLRMRAAPRSKAMRALWRLEERDLSDEVREAHRLPILSEIAPMNLSWRLFRSEKGPGWIERYWKRPSIRDLMRSHA